MKGFLLMLFLGIASYSFALNDVDEYFMVTQSATTASVISARQKALMFAKNTLATMVSGKVENVTKSYIDHDSEAGKSADHFVTETKMSTRMLLQGIRVADENVVQEKEGKYTVYITLKLKKDEVLTTLCKRLTEHETTKDVFQKDMFIDLWKKEN